MRDVIEALVGIIEFLIQGAIAACVVFYLVAFFHPTIRGLKGYLAEHWEVLTGSEEGSEVVRPFLVALGLASLYFLGIVTNVVNYWVLAPVHHALIARAQGIASSHQLSANQDRQRPDQICPWGIPREPSGHLICNLESEKQFALAAFTSLILRENIHSKAYAQYLSSDAAWRNGNLAAHSSILPGLKKIIRIVRGVVVASFLVVLIATTKILVSIVFVCLFAASPVSRGLEWLSVRAYKYFISYDAYRRGTAWNAREAVSTGLRGVIAPNLLLLGFAATLFIVASLSYRTVETEYQLLVISGESSTVPASGGEKNHPKALLHYPSITNES